MLINVTCVALLKDILQSFLQTNQIVFTYSVSHQNALYVLFRANKCVECISFHITVTKYFRTEPSQQPPYFLLFAGALFLGTVEQDETVNRSVSQTCYQSTRCKKIVVKNSKPVPKQSTPHTNTHIEKHANLPTYTLLYNAQLS